MRVKSLTQVPIEISAAEGEVIRRAVEHALADKAFMSGLSSSDHVLLRIDFPAVVDEALAQQRLVYEKLYKGID